MAEIITLSLIAIIALLGFFGNVIFNRTNIPSTLWLLLFGLLLSQVFNFVDREALTSMTNIMGAIAIITILSEGGMSLDIREMILEAPKGFLLLVVGLIFSVGATVGIMLAFGFSLEIALFTGLALGGTSASVVMPIVTKMKGLSEKVISILSFESIADTFTIVIALFVLDVMTGEIAQISIGSMINPIFSGITIGLFVGVIWGFLLRKLKNEEHNYVATLAILFLTYAVAEYVNASGAIACFTAGIALGNYDLFSKFINPRKEPANHFETIKFHSLITFFVRTFYFVFVGAIVLITNYLGMLVGGLICVAFLVVRFFYVKILTRGDKSLTNFDKNTMTVLFPRGLSAAVLATIPLSRGIEGADIVVDIVFSVIIGTILISTIGMLFVMRRHNKKFKEDQKSQKRKNKAKLEQKGDGSEE
jgi:cell volume regulation protein A